MKTDRIFKDIAGFPGYQVSDDGDVISFWRVRKNCRHLGTTPKPVSQSLTHGHLKVNLNSDGKKYCRYVHSLMLIAFRGPRPRGCVARHLNDIPTDNILSNLAWGTPVENAEDALRNGRLPYGEKASAAKLSRAVVERILVRLSQGESQRSLAKEHGVTQTLVSLIKRGRRRKRELSTEPAK